MYAKLVNKLLGVKSGKTRELKHVILKPLSRPGSYDVYEMKAKATNPCVFSSKFSGNNLVSYVTQFNIIMVTSF